MQPRGRKLAPTTDTDKIQTIKNNIQKFSQSQKASIKKTAKNSIASAIGTLIQGQRMTQEEVKALGSQVLDLKISTLSTEDKQTLIEGLSIVGYDVRNLQYYSSLPSSSSASAPAGGETEQKGGDEEDDEEEEEDEEEEKQQQTDPRQITVPQSMPVSMPQFTPEQPAKPSEINVLTPAEKKETEKDLDEYIGKKANMKTERMVMSIGGFEEYINLKKKFKLNDSKQINMDSFFDSHKFELQLSNNDKSDYNEKELLVLYNAYLINRFEVSTVDNLKVGAVIDLKKVIGKTFTLKDLLNVAMVPNRQQQQQTLQPVGDINVGAVERKELTGADTMPSEPVEIKRQLQIDGKPQRLVNPDTSISGLLQQFEGSHTKEIPKFEQLTEDTAGNIAKYEINVISRRKKLHIYDRN
jgi:hypothetical protein